MSRSVYIVKRSNKRYADSREHDETDASIQGSLTSALFIGPTCVVRKSTEISIVRLYAPVYCKHVQERSLKTSNG